MSQSGPEAPLSGTGRILTPIPVLHRLEQGLVIVALLAAAFLPLSDMVGRALGGHYIPGGADWLQQVVLWLAFLGGLLATREQKHLTLSTAELFGEGRVRRFGHVMAAALSAGTVAILAYAAVDVVRANREEAKLLSGGLPVWVSESVMPVALGLMALRFAWTASTHRAGRVIAFLSIPAAFAFGLFSEQAAALSWPVAVLILVALLLGAPVFVAMGAFSLFFFFQDGVPVSAVTAEVYRLISSPTLPAIPLLTACGYVLAESGASVRLLRFLRSLLGSMPGGLAVIVTLVCALFTIVGSGVTIIAVGGLVYPMLRKDGYPEGFSLGLVTSAGSQGLLFPPSLPVILYSVVVGTREHSVPVGSLYLAGFLPGLLLLGAVAAYAVQVGRGCGQRQAFAGPEVLAAASAARWELLLPVFMIGLFASGAASIVETAAAALAYVVVVECFVTRDIHPTRGLPATLARSAVLTGAILILLSAAMSITSYIVDAQIPDHLVHWVTTHIDSRFVFLLTLNALLLVVGSLVEMFAAIVALAPLIVPLGAAFGLHPLHLGVIFLANLELGFLMPPFGLNLFLAASRFEKPLTEVTRHTLPFLLITGLAVLLISYVPWLSLALPAAFGK